MLWSSGDAGAEKDSHAGKAEEKESIGEFIDFRQLK